MLATVEKSLWKIKAEQTGTGSSSASASRAFAVTKPGGRRGRGHRGRGGQVNARGTTGAATTTNTTTEIQCWYFSRKGHKQAGCHFKKKVEGLRKSWDEKRGSRGGEKKADSLARGSGQASVNLAITSSAVIEELPDDYTVDSYTFMAYEEYTKLPEGWYIDSVATDHVCYDHTLFADYQPLMMPRPRPALGHLRHRNIPTINSTPPAIKTTESQEITHTPVVVEITEIHSQTLRLWHQRLGHRNMADLRRLVGRANGLLLAFAQESAPPAVCPVCIEGKQHWIFNRRVPKSHAEAPLALVHSDSCGLFCMASIARAKYFVLFANDYTRMTWVHFLPTMGHQELLGAFQEFKANVKKHSGRSILRLCCDNGHGEYTKEFFLSNYVQKGLTISPQRRTHSKRMVRASGRFTASWRRLATCCWRASCLPASGRRQ